MKKHIYILIWFGLALTASAQSVLVATNNYNDLNPDRDAQSIAAGTLRLTLTVTDGAAPMSFSNVAPVRLVIRDIRDDYTNQTVNASLTNSAAGVVRWASGVISAGSYETYCDVQVESETRRIWWSYLVVTNAATSGGSIQPVPTNINLGPITIDNTTINTGIVGVAVTTNDAPAGVTTNEDGIATINIPPGGGGGIASIVGMSPIVVTNDGETTYIGFNTLSGYLIVPPVATNYQQIGYVANTAQTYVVGASVTTLYVSAWGAGGGAGSTLSGNGAGAGGLTYGALSVTGGMVLTIEVPEGGYFAEPTNNSLSGIAWPDGGSGAGTNLYGAGGGGGSLRIWHETNLVLVAGGGGGGLSNMAGGGGGGTSGGDGSANGASLAAGTGGNQSSGGVTNGAYLTGGSATAGTVNRGISGGGGGYYGGGAAYWVSAGAHYASGGGGSGWYNPIYFAVAVTVRSGYGANVAGIDDPLFGSGWAAGGDTASERGGNGGAIFRW